MKTINYINRLTAVIAMLLMAMNVFSQTPPITTIGTPVPDQIRFGTYTVPVTVANFANNVGNISLTMKYDVKKLTYTGIELNKGISANAVTTRLTDVSGQIKLSYFSNTPIILDPLDPTTLFKVTFTAKPGVQGISTPLTWSYLQGACDYTDQTGAVYTPALSPTNYSTYFFDGSIAVPNAPTITGPLVNGLPATISGEETTGQVYTTEPGMSGYVWTVSAAGTITAGDGTNSITVTWSYPTGEQSVSVNYFRPEGSVTSPSGYSVNYYPFAAAIDPFSIPQFVDPMPHFAAGLRVDAKAGGDLTVKTVVVKQKTLSTGTVLPTGTIGDPQKPLAGLGNYEAYAVSKNGGTTYGPAMWPAQTIEAMQGKQLKVQYLNNLGKATTYKDFNILADQTLLLNGYPKNGNPLTDPYAGPIPMSVHLHGGEMPSNSDGGPTAWWMPTGYDGPNALGPGFADDASSLCTYPNTQEGTTLWYHPHDQGLTRINVYTGLAGYYFLRGKNEDNIKLPGWSGDDKVLEVTPTDANNGHPRTTTFNTLFFGVPTPYLPEIELAIQDRMFNVNGELYWPVQPTNPEVHPFWTPEFFGDVMTVNGKSWPYLSVAPRKYTFRMLDGCNARFLNLWLEQMVNNGNSPGIPGPKITVLATEGGFLDTPAVIDPSVIDPITHVGQKLFLAPAERPIVIIDFTGIPAGTVFTLRNDANAPYPTGTPPTVGLQDRIMQFVVNGTLMKADGTPGGTDKSLLSGYSRPTPMVKLTDYNGATTVTPLVKRQLLLNEITGAGGPEMVAVNNSHFDASTPLLDVVDNFGGPMEIPTEGTTEVWQIINTTVDAHPMHIHLSQWQLVSRQKFDVAAYMAKYADDWSKNPKGLPNFPSIAAYPGGSGSPNDYNIPNSDNALGGNPSITSYLTPGTLRYANPEEKGWKDAIKALPGEVSTYICRFAPTELPINTPADKLVYPFDPSIGPGYVWHCHIIDHEDMDMMRPLQVVPNPSRYPQFTQPSPYVACAGDIATFNAPATSLDNNLITYQWQVKTNTVDWTDIIVGAPGPYADFTKATLRINTSVPSLSTNQYRCIAKNVDGTSTSNAALLTVNDCKISGTLKYNNANHDILDGMTVTANSKSAVVPIGGTYSIAGVTSGLQTVTVATTNNKYFVGSVNSTDAGIALYWSTHYSPIEHVKFLAGDVNNDNSIYADDALAIQRYFVFNDPFARTPWSFWNAAGTITDNSDTHRTDPINVMVNGTSVTLDLLGMATGDINGSLNPLAAKSASDNLQLTYGETRTMGANQEFELPLRTSSSMEVGAVSLILNIPSDLVEVKDVFMKGSNEKLSFNVKGNELRIGWNSLTPVNLQAAGDLFTLKLKTTPAFTEGKTIKLKLVSNPLNEIANGSFTVIPQAILNTDAVIGINDKPASIALSSYPNPFSDNTTISYTIPVDANVTLQIYNLLGVAVKNLVNEHQSGGTYTVKMDASKLQHGTYTAILRINDNTKTVERTIKIVVNK